MNARQPLRLGVLAVVAIALSAFALDALVGASATGTEPTHKEKKAKHATYECNVKIYNSNVQNNNFCSPHGKTGGKGGAHCKDCKPTKKTPPPPPKDVNCEAGGFYAVNQCDVGGDATTTINDPSCTWDCQVVESSGDSQAAQKKKPRGVGSSTECTANGDTAVNQCDVEGDATTTVGADGHAQQKASVSGEEAESQRVVPRPKGGAGQTTTCTANGFIAINQCDVDGDANAWVPASGYGTPPVSPAAMGSAGPKALGAPDETAYEPEASTESNVAVSLLDGVSAVLGLVV